MLAPAEADLSGLVRVNHWSPTDFTFRGEDERAYIAELTWPGRRAILELWRDEPGRDGLPVPLHRPNRSELYAEPAALACPDAMSEILAECAALAGEAVTTIGLDDLEAQPRYETLLSRLRAWPVALLQRGALSPVDRAGAGRTLARLRDPRPGVGVRPDGLPDIVWCEVPAGSKLFPPRRSAQSQSWASSSSPGPRSPCFPGLL